MKCGNLSRQSVILHVNSVFFLVLAIAAFLLPAIMDLDPFAKDGIAFSPPSGSWWLGTNNLGQDCFARLLYGLRSSLIVGVAAAILATVIGTAVGITGGFAGGWVDSFLTSVTNLLLVVPQLVILILISNSIQNSSLPLLAVFIGCTSWVWIARALQAQAGSLRLREHVAQARLNGAGIVSLLVKQVLPYVSSYVFMAFIMQLGSAIFSEAALSMLGLGPRGSEVISLGSILDNAKSEGFSGAHWWVFLPPTIIITLFMFALYSMNTALEGVFNPRLRIKN
jgi:peptide/nickel transport system permease protein